MKNYKMNEETLSDKINDYGYNYDGTPDNDVLGVEDVKEFIKRLKEELDFHMPKDIIIETIDKLAGKELIEETGEFKK